MENAIHWISQLDSLILIRWIVIYPPDSRRHLASEHPGLVVDHRQYGCLPYNLRIKENTNLPKQDVIIKYPGGIPGVGWVGVKGTPLVLTETMACTKIFEHDILFCRSDSAFISSYFFHIMRTSITSKVQ